MTERIEEALANATELKVYHLQNKDGDNYDLVSLKELATTVNRDPKELIANFHLADQYTAKDVLKSPDRQVGLRTYDPDRLLLPFTPLEDILNNIEVDEVAVGYEWAKIVIALVKAGADRAEALEIKGDDVPEVMSIIQPIYVWSNDGKKTFIIVAINNQSEYINLSFA